jgi:hypothetical protein
MLSFKRSHTVIDWMPRGNDTAEALLERVRNEYRELPTLNLTFAQACRLWQMDPCECQRVLERLIAEGVLRRTVDGLFVSSETLARRRRQAARHASARGPSRLR